MILRTPRALLRPFGPQDGDALAALMRDPEIMRRTGFRTPQPEAAIQRHLQDLLLRSGASSGVWAGELDGPQAPGSPMVAWVMLKDTGEPWHELGFMVRREAQGQGLATELSQALITRARDSGQRRIMARCDPDHQASKAVLTKLGFTRRWPSAAQQERDPQTLVYTLDLDAPPSWTP